MNDICIRAVKTFIQAFLGIFIPEIVLIINNAAWAELSWPAILFSPLFCSSLAAALSATWNLLETWFKSQDTEFEELDDFPFEIWNPLSPEADDLDLE